MYIPHFSYVFTYQLDDNNVSVLVHYEKYTTLIGDIDGGCSWMRGMWELCVIFIEL